MIALETDRRINSYFDDLFRRLFSNLFNFHPTFGRSHDNRQFFGPVKYDTKIEFILDVRTLFNINLLNKFLV